MKCSLEESPPPAVDLKEPLIVLSSTEQIFFSDPLIVSELSFESLLLPGDPLPTSLDLPLSNN
jgi:hypothetical protein